MQVVSFADLYAGKIVVAFDRQHHCAPRCPMQNGASWRMTWSAFSFPDRNARRRTACAARRTFGRMKSREEQLTWAKQRALICVDVGHFSDAVAGLRADLDENPLTKGVVSSDQARRGY
jgi:hypothetical protein